MRPLLIAVSGLGLALVMFVSGLIAATAFFTAEPERQLALSTDDVWTDRPLKVNPATQEFDRLAARPVPQQVPARAPTQRTVTSVVADTAKTEPPLPEASTQPQQGLQAETTTAHLQWCSDRYRSYRPDDNSYTSYSGERRECLSPYLGAGDGSADEYTYEETTYRPSQAQPELAYASEDAAYVGADHVDYCFSRYRSYRPEDNTYQPYDGGPRRQCR
ncbi:BA14K family protein [Aminobacter aganoensis]|uniref:Lectin-like protein BA14k n=1 Tax=Aminobacter aganoensis TaxID=83264 RepID=A0A7X0KN43_9HYPH|nr:BA14K family protein [Aminobacter aganoensis]MBB6356699.1 hypothetical protein [Aminobacter aganoensis]